MGSFCGPTSGLRGQVGPDPGSGPLWHLKPEVAPQNDPIAGGCLVSTETQITPVQLHRHGPKRACAARCRPLVCYQAGRTGPCRTAPSPQAPHTTPHPPRPPVGPFSASTRPDSAAAVRSAPPPCRHVPALPGWFAPPHGGERRRAAAHRPYGSPGCAPCRPARRLRQEGGHGHRNRCPGCLGACGARPRSAYIPVVWNATHVQMRAPAASTPHGGCH